MEDQLNLRVNDDNQVVVVETVEQETPISSAELQRQIAEHAAVIVELKKKLAFVQQFEEDNSNDIMSEENN